MCQVDNGTNKTNQKQGKPETDYLNQAWTINRRKFGSVGRGPPVPIDIGFVMISGVYPIKTEVCGVLFKSVHSVWIVSAVLK